MADISISDLKVQIKGILKNADLTTLSSKKIRQQLEETFSVDFTDRKKEIDSLVMEVISARENNNEEEEKTEELVKGEKKHSQNGPRQSESEDQSMTAGGSSAEDLEEDEETEPKEKKKKNNERATEVSKKPKPVQEAKSKPVKKSTPKQGKKIPVSSSQVSDSDTDDSDVNMGLNDEELAKKLQQEEDGGRRSRHRAVKKLPKHENTEKKPKKKREGSAIIRKPCLLSPDLAAIMGKDKMPRNEVVKRMWEIVKERNLMDPKDKRYMLCDEQLFKVFHNIKLNRKSPGKKSINKGFRYFSEGYIQDLREKKRVLTFAMMKALKFHITSESSITY